MVTDSVSPIQQSSQEENENALDLLHPGYDGIEKRWAPLASDGVCKPWLKEYMLDKDREVESKDGLGLDTKGKKSNKLLVLVFSGHSFP